MELWLLGAGAVVLVGITLWIVWPARTADAVGVSVRSEEVSEKPMTETVKTGLAPQGDRFADQYTSATADLSAGGVAGAAEGMHEDPGALPRVAHPSYGASASPTLAITQPESGPLAQKRNVGLGMGAVLALAGGVGGAWVYARWQRERSKPINRLRRGARVMANRLGERIPDVDELPHGTAPMSGAATALLLTALIVSRAVRRDADDPAEQLEDVVHEATKRGRKIVAQGRQESARLASDNAPRKPAVMGIGVGGLALVAGGAYAVWRLMHRGEPDRSTWYTGDQ
jgi:hypothetical protein